MPPYLRPSEAAPWHPGCRAGTSLIVSRVDNFACPLMKRVTGWWAAMIDGHSSTAGGRGGGEGPGGSRGGNGGAGGGIAGVGETGSGGGRNGGWGGGPGMGGKLGGGRSGGRGGGGDVGGSKGGGGDGLGGDSGGEGGKGGGGCGKRYEMRRSSTWEMGAPQRVLDHTLNSSMACSTVRSRGSPSIIKLSFHSTAAFPLIVVFPSG
mmetsp:Transcript_46455/g.104719  ORF Transcript_46455/g.104719 Transcript_46455/m.104719 type:complete len:206 (+) Transcript_46455:1045-1662(+)